MGRKPRDDGPGVWHHVFNRGVARRTVFEDERDVRFFLSRLARVVRAGSIEVHAYCLLTTHFHLLVRSSEAGISRALQRVLNDYVRWFNRSRKRDGPLFSGRFRSRPVETLEYRRTLIRYIDDNPVLARLVPEPQLYPHGSARHYARRRGPPWLERSWVEGEVRALTPGCDYDPAGYPACFGARAGEGLARVVERRIESGIGARDPLDDLLGAAPERVLDWMRRKAALADGTRIDLPVCDVADVRELVGMERTRREEWILELPRVRSCGWKLVEVALRRDLCAEGWAEIGTALGMAEQGALRAYRLHGRALIAVDDYAQTVTRLSGELLRRCYGPRATVGIRSS